MEDSKVVSPSSMKASLDTENQFCQDREKYRACHEVHHGQTKDLDVTSDAGSDDSFISASSQDNVDETVSCECCNEGSVSVSECLHCNRQICLICMKKHTMILKERLNISSSKISRQREEFSQAISELRQCKTRINRSQTSTIKQIQKWYDESLVELQNKKKTLLGEVDRFVNEEKRVLEEKEKSLEKNQDKMATFCSNSALYTKTKSLDEENLPEQQKSLLEMIEKSNGRIHVVEGTASRKYIQFCGHESRSAIRSIRKFKGVKICDSSEDRRVRSDETADGNSIDFNEGSDAGYSDSRHTSSSTECDVFDGVNGCSSPGKEWKTVREFGKHGDEEGSLRYPNGIAITEYGEHEEIIVADRFNNRIQVFDLLGRPVRTFGSQGRKEGHFDEPCDVCVASTGEIVVAGYKNNRVQVFDQWGRFIRKFGEGELRRPSSVAINTDGLIFVADSSNGIKVFSMDGDFIGTFGQAWLDSSSRGKYVAVTQDGKIAVSEYSKHGFGVFDEYRERVLEVGGQGSGKGKFNSPGGISFDGEGNIAVADTENHRIQIFDKSGKFLSSFGCEGSELGEMTRPDAVAFLKNGDVVVCDTWNHRIQIFTQS